MSDVTTNACPLGLTETEVRDLMGERHAEFMTYMRGQTLAVCNGTRYDFEAKQYEDTECIAEPHGIVVYPWDAQRFLDLH